MSRPNHFLNRDRAKQAMSRSTLTRGKIKSCEDVLSLTRQMQELWLFGQLKTLEPSDETRTRVDENAREIGALMAQLMSMKSPAKGDIEAKTLEEPDAMEQEV